MDKELVYPFPPEVVYSLVIPCYNESKNLYALVDRCEFLLNKREDVEVLLVDNGSIDDTDEVLMDLSKNCNHPRLRTTRVAINRGYGFGIKAGLKLSVGKVLGWTHADLQTDPADFLDAIKFFDKEKDSANKIFVKGERHGRPFRDVVFTRGMSLVERLLLGVRMCDINAQPTVFSRDFFLSWNKPPDDFSLDLFAYHESIKNNLPTKRFPVEYGLRLSGIGHNETLYSKIKYSWKTVLFSFGLRKHLRAIEKGNR